MLLLNSARTSTSNQLCLGKISSNVPRKLLRKKHFTDVNFTNACSCFLEANVILNERLWHDILRNECEIQHIEHTIYFIKAVRQFKSSGTISSTVRTRTCARTCTITNTTDAHSIYDG